jgi:hypothetical protein
MRNLLRLSAVLGLLLFASPAHAQVSFGFSFGQPPPAPRAYRVPAQPAPNYVWVEGYWYRNGNRWSWRDGYWANPPYDGAYWVEPYWDGRAYVGGYWETSRGRFRHDRFWNRGRGRR